MAFLYPYGDSQQLNLSWFLSTFRELYEYVQNLEPGESSMDAILSRFTALYDGSKSYTAGQYCINDGKIYKAINNTTGSFNPSDWTPALPVDEIDTLRQDIAGLAGDVEDLGDDAVTDISYTPGTAAQPGSLSQTKAGQSAPVMAVDAEPTENSNNPVKSGGVYEELTELKGALNAKVLTPSSTKAIPTAGNSAPYPLTGLTDQYVLVRWGFSSSAENSPPTDLTWTTSSNQFVIQNTGSVSPTETIKPVFALPNAI